MTLEATPGSNTGRFLSTARRRGVDRDAYACADERTGHGMAGREPDAGTDEARV
jgi:hypothetical protein